jgi:hypothetical protein
MFPFVKCDLFVATCTSKFIVVIVMDQEMVGLFRPLEDYVGLSILTVGAICLVVLLGVVC